MIDLNEVRNAQSTLREAKANFYAALARAFPLGTRVKFRKANGEYRGIIQVWADDRFCLRHNNGMRRWHYASWLLRDGCEIVKMKEEFYG